MLIGTLKNEQIRWGRFASELGRLACQMAARAAGWPPDYGRYGLRHRSMPAPAGNNAQVGRALRCKYAATLPPGLGYERCPRNAFANVPGSRHLTHLNACWPRLVRSALKRW
jgi:hypothetical protein